MEKILRLAGQYNMIVYDIIDETYKLLLRAPIEVFSLAMFQDSSGLFVMIVIGPETFAFGGALYRTLKRKIS